MEHIHSNAQKIDETLESLNGISSAEPKLFFYTRLHARMERELLQTKTVLVWQLKPIYALSAVVIVIIINIFTLVNLQKTEKNSQEQYRLYEIGSF